MQIPGHNRPHFAFIDLIRVCACFLVILLHVSAIQFESFFPAWPTPLVYDSIARMAVPLFFMISGFLLLDEPVLPLASFYYKRYARILIPFSAVCVLYYFSSQYTGFSVPDYLIYISSHFVDYHLWYVYALSGLYLSVPFFSKIIHGADGAKLAWLYIGIWVASFIALPAITGYRQPPAQILALMASQPNHVSNYVLSEVATSDFSGFGLLFYYGFMGYLICGWLIRKNLKKFTTPLYWLNFLVFICASAAIIMATWSRSIAMGRPDQAFFSGSSPFVLLQAISFFIFCSQFKSENWLIRDLSDKAYWIYLLHIILLRLFVGIQPLPIDYSNIACIPLYALIIFTTAYFAAIPLRALEERLLNFIAQS